MIVVAVIHTRHTRALITVFAALVVCISGADAADGRRPPTANQAQMPGTLRHIAVADLPRITSARLGNSPLKDVPRFLPGQKFTIAGKNFVAPGIEPAMPPASASAPAGGGNKFGAAKIKVYVLSQVLNYSGTLGGDVNKGLAPIFKIAAVMIPLEGSPTELLVQMSPKLEPGLYFLQAEVHGKGKSNPLPVEVVGMNADLSPRITTLEPRQAKPMQTVQVTGIRLPDPGMVQFTPVQSALGKTLTTTLVVQPPKCGGWDGSWCKGVAYRTFTVPYAAIEGDYRVRITSPDMKTTTNSSDFAVIPAKTPVFAISYVGFKAIKTTKGLTASTDEPYMAAIVFDMQTREWTTHWGQVLEGIEPGQSISETVRLFTGTPDPNRYIVVAGMAECDNYFTDFNYISPLDPTPVQTWNDDENVDQQSWATVPLRKVEWALFCAFTNPGNNSGSSCDYPDLRGASRAQVATFIQDQLSQALAYRGNTLGVAEVHYTGDDVAQARVSNGAQPVIKTADFTRGGGHYQPSFHLRLLKNK